MDPVFDDTRSLLLISFSVIMAVWPSKKMFIFRINWPQIYVGVK